MSDRKAMRDAFGQALVELGKLHPDVIVLSGDLEDSTRAEFFKKEFPGRFFNMGISEQDMVAEACGLAREGFVPFVCSFGVFLTNRAYDMIRISVCFNRSNVKLIGSHVGLTVGPDGATAQCLEDLALMRVLPEMVVLSPADANETRQATFAMVAFKGPVYMRFSRASVPLVIKENAPFEIGKGRVLKEGHDVTLVATGVMVQEALQAREVLLGKGIQARLINMSTIKPLDEALISQAVQETGAIVTAEEHQLFGGLGSAVCEVLAQRHPAPVEMVAARDTFGESGKPQELLKKYHLSCTDIVEAAQRAIKRKRS